MKYHVIEERQSWVINPEDSTTYAQIPIKLPDTKSKDTLKNFAIGEFSRNNEINSPAQLYGPDRELWHEK